MLRFKSVVNFAFIKFDIEVKVEYIIKSCFVNETY